jgi:L-serine dehydratase
VLLGLEGLRPDLTDPELAESRSAEIRAAGTLLLNGRREIAFQEERDLSFLRHETLPRHANAMRLRALTHDGSILDEETYYSVGGGFVETDGASPVRDEESDANPYPFSSAAELLAIGARTGLALWEIVLANELALRAEATIRAYVAEIWNVMECCIARGLATEGILPGGLNVRRRAPRLYRKLEAKTSAANGLDAMDEVNAVAMAVNEENAAGGRVVTAPTNGAAGVIPAVVHYYRRYAEAPAEQAVVRFFLTATAIGGLYKENASISGAEVGCQGEVGVACSMAAGGLVGALGGSNEQVEYAAEIGMEHSLGMTCDPIGGLVQIPCIERNAVGAVRAIHAARMAMQEDDEHRVSLDQVIEVMYRTGLDMQTKYKETSLGGLAVGVVEC